MNIMKIFIINLVINLYKNFCFFLNFKIKAFFFSEPDNWLIILKREFLLRYDQLCQFHYDIIFNDLATSFCLNLLLVYYDTIVLLILILTIVYWCLYKIIDDHLYKSNQVLDLNFFLSNLLIFCRFILLFILDTFFSFLLIEEDIVVDLFFEDLPLELFLLVDKYNFEEKPSDFFDILDYYISLFNFKYTQLWMYLFLGKIKNIIFFDYYNNFYRFNYYLNQKILTSFEFTDYDKDIYNAIAVIWTGKKVEKAEIKEKFKNIYNIIYENEEEYYDEEKEEEKEEIIGEANKAIHRAIKEAQEFLRSLPLTPYNNFKERLETLELDMFFEAISSDFFDDEEDWFLSGLATINMNRGEPVSIQLFWIKYMAFIAYNFSIFKKSIFLYLFPIKEKVKEEKPWFILDDEDADEIDFIKPKKSDLIYKKYIYNCFAKIHNNFFFKKKINLLFNGYSIDFIKGNIIKYTNDIYYKIRAEDYELLVNEILDEDFNDKLNYYLNNVSNKFIGGGVPLNDSFFSIRSLKMMSEDIRNNMSINDIFYFFLENYIKSIISNKDVSNKDVSNKDSSFCLLLNEYYLMASLLKLGYNNFCLQSLEFGPWYDHILKAHELNHNLKFEYIWAFFPSCVISILIVPAFFLLYSLEVFTDAFLLVQIIGHQWFWSYEIANNLSNSNSIIFESHLKELDSDEYKWLNYQYKMSPTDRSNEADGLSEVYLMLNRRFINNYSHYNRFLKNRNFWISKPIFDELGVYINGYDLGLKRLLDVDKHLILPINKDLLLSITSTDVLHAFSIPNFGLKVDAVPGRINTFWLRITKPGFYYGQCSELCGQRHGFMPIVIEGQFYYNSYNKDILVKISNPALVLKDVNNLIFEERIKNSLSIDVTAWEKNPIHLGNLWIDGPLDDDLDLESRVRRDPNNWD